MFDDFGATRNRGETAKKEFTTRDEKDVLTGKFGELGFGTRKTGTKNVNCVSSGFEGGFLGVNGTHNSASEVEITVRKEGDFHRFIIACAGEYRCFMAKFC